MIQHKSKFLLKVKPISRPLVIPDRTTENDLDVKSEGETTVDGLPNNTGRILAPNENIFDLTHTKTKAETFAIFVDYLYNKLPSPIHNLNDAKRAIQAYILAVDYEVITLQNSLVDKLRDYHKTTHFDMDLLVLMGRRTDIDRNLTQYLIAQFAYDISSEGYDVFQANNKFLTLFLTDNDSHVRREVVKAIVDVAWRAMGKQRIEDPANRKGEMLIRAC